MSFVKEDNDYNLQYTSISDKSFKTKLKDIYNARTVKYPNVDIVVQDKDVVYLGSDGKYYQALADGSEKENIVGMYDATTDRLITYGIVEVSQTFDYGTKIYLSSSYPGKIQSQESNVLIGVSLGNNKILFNPHSYSGIKANKDLSNVNDAIILNKLKNVDGVGSGLDADTLDGHDSAYFANKTLSNVDDSDILNKLVNVDGSGSGLDADLLDGRDSSDFADAVHDHDDRYYTKTQSSETIILNPNLDTSVQDKDFVYLGNDNKYYQALADGTVKEDVVGIYDATNDRIITYGIVNIGVTVDFGKIVYLSESDAGKTQTTPSKVTLGTSLGNGYILLHSDKPNYDILDTRYALSSDTSANLDNKANKDLSNVNDSDILDKLKNVDGDGSGLDADLLDGLDSSQFVRSDSDDTLTGNYTIDGGLTVTQNVNINGNLTVSGTVTHINTETVDIEDNVILLNSNATGTPSENAGMEVERGDETNVKLIWNEALDDWYLTTGGTEDYKIWHEGNDGPNSGLDADTVDGKQAADLANVDLSNVDDDDILNKIKNVDGTGSGLDADLLDGKQAADLANVDLSNVDDNDILNKIKNVDGANSGLDADMLDGHDSTYFATADHLHDDRYYTEEEVNAILEKYILKEDLIYRDIILTTFYNQVYRDLFLEANTLDETSNLTYDADTTSYSGSNNAYLIQSILNNDSNGFRDFLVHVEAENDNYTVEYSLDNKSTWTTINSDEDIHVNQDITNLDIRITFTNTNTIYSFGVVYDLDE